MGTEPWRSLKNQPLKADENPDIVRAELERTGLHLAGINGVFSLDDLDETNPDHYNRIFYKEKYVQRMAGPYSENCGSILEERLIVIYSIKYKHFMEHKRTCDLARAQKLINQKNNKKIDRNCELFGTFILGSDPS